MRISNGAGLSLSLSPLYLVLVSLRLSVCPSVRRRRPPLGGNASSFFHSSRSSLFPRLMPLLQLVRVYTPTFLFFPLPICFLLLLLFWGNSFQSFHLVEDFFFSLVGRKEISLPDKESSEDKKSGNNMASFLLCCLKDGQLDATALSPRPISMTFYEQSKEGEEKKLQITSEICAPAEGAILERRGPAQPAKNKSIQYRFICSHFCCDFSRPVKWEKIFIV